VILGPEKMIIVPPGHYCVIQNPVIRDNDGIIQYDLYGQSKLRHADLEIRLQQDPFPLYPGEVLVILGPEKMIIVPPGHYCVIQNPVIRDNDGIIQYDLYGQSKLRHADLEIRLQQDPFPLYPGEVLFQ
ncbi:major vault protein-like, partial [Centruroides sculpturatus]|uniref:major vault protein-like n=1 Tax=Centruroides sculpturatus TaxID=218467 RepID=UPI000C6DA4C3